MFSVFRWSKQLVYDGVSSISTAFVTVWFHSLHALLMLYSPTFVMLIGVTVDRPGALVSHVQALCSVLNDTGEALLSRGYADMAQFILHSAK